MDTDVGKLLPHLDILHFPTEVEQARLTARLLGAVKEDEAEARQRVPTVGDCQVAGEGVHVLNAHGIIMGKKQRQVVEGRQLTQLPGVGESHAGV